MKTDQPKSSSNDQCSLLTIPTEVREAILKYLLYSTGPLSRVERVAVVRKPYAHLINLSQPAPAGTSTARDLVDVEDTSDWRVWEASQEHLVPDAWKYTTKKIQGL